MTVSKLAREQTLPGKTDGTRKAYQPGPTGPSRAISLTVWLGFLPSGTKPRDETVCETCPCFVSCDFSTGNHTPLVRSLFRRSIGPIPSDREDNAGWSKRQRIFQIAYVRRAAGRGLWRSGDGLSLATAGSCTPAICSISLFWLNVDLTCLSSSSLFLVTREPLRLELRRKLLAIVTEL